MPIKNRPPGQTQAPAEEIVSPDALALVRYRIRRADDPRIENTVRVIDHLLRVEIARGPGWHRYPGDGYGEHESNAPFDGIGIGRVWPLLAGKRRHYELARGDRDEARRLLQTMANQSSDGGLIPEQVWDAPDIKEFELINGRPSGSAIPLVWARAEFIQLRRSLQDGEVFGLPRDAAARYARGATGPTLEIWSRANRRRSMPSGRLLRIDSATPGTVLWRAGDDTPDIDAHLAPSGLETYYVDLPTSKLGRGDTLSSGTIFSLA